MILFVSVNVNAQFILEEDLYAAGVAISGYVPDVDSVAATNIYSSTYTDWTLIDGLATLSFIYAYTTAGNTSDTLMLILQGKRYIHCTG